MSLPYYAVLGIPLIFLLGLLGSLIPPLAASYFPNFKLTDKFYFSFFNGLAGGLIITVGYVHSIVEANESFSEALTGDSDVERYPWAFLIAVVGTLLVFFVQEIVTIYASKMVNLVHGNHQCHSYGTLGHMKHHHHHQHILSVGAMDKSANLGISLLVLSTQCIEIDQSPNFDKRFDLAPIYIS